ncbi:MAG: hypothetical protein HY677_05185 [Chloroflexi bacterium]|nr:hypothetical protein [Chloroflexota bacterium]
MSVRPFIREELRLDVDGRYPQMAASGAIFASLTTKVSWIANLTASGANSWKGDIWYKDGDSASFPFTTVEVQVISSSSSQRSAAVTFSGGGAASRVHTHRFKSPYFHPVELEFDSAQGTPAVTSVQTHAHANRPATLPNEALSIEMVYRRTGFDVKKSGGDGAVPLSLAGANARWSDMEMHDAMQSYWSRFANKSQWSMWVFFASLHEQGTSLGGVMFDDIGPNHRQGTSIFNDAFIANAPAGDVSPAAWVQRMRFWTACHEMGHAFNLAHSWQKALATSWIPLANEPEARSFMNYPYNVAGGQTAFFADFEFRFTDSELLFMRHAPERFVQMGNADWFDHHAFQQAEVSPEPPFKLELRVNRPNAVFEFLEPAVLELKLTNISSQPQLVHENALSAVDQMTVILKKPRKPARQFVPFAQYCLLPAVRALMPGESLYDSLFVSAGRNGWDLAEPGYYTVQVALHLADQDIVSLPLTLRVAPPRQYDEEFLAQDFFSDDVGRILTFDGSRFLSGGNDTLREVADRLSDRRVAIHARVALGNPLARDYKLLDLGAGSRDLTSAYAVGGKIAVAKANEDEAHKDLRSALIEKKDVGVESLGHIDYKYYVDRFSDWLAERGSTQEAVQAQEDLYQVLAARKVLDRVLQQVKERRESYQLKS